MDVKKFINYERLFFKVLMSFSLLICIILIAIFVLYTHGKHLADTCNFNVITLSGVPYESADDKFELTGNFVRARDGGIWLMAYGLWLMAYGLWLMAYGLWGLIPLL
ncbi:hypothetical protein [Pantoea ananatis]|uniref:hypothetical protein n=1 Tax=Pantoea ananas TaxID=553 RepID=UPI001B310ED6|nr:hypothetical protein [Pantoea ananatis]